MMMPTHYSTFLHEILQKSLPDVRLLITDVDG